MIVAPGVDVITENTLINLRQEHRIGSSKSFKAPHISTIYARIGTGFHRT